MRAKIKVSGIVQGVGFRPFIYRTAVKNKLVGYIRNRGDGVVDIVVEGKKNNITHFLEDLKEKKPPLSRIYDVNINYLEERKEALNRWNEYLESITSQTWTCCRSCSFYSNIKNC